MQDYHLSDEEAAQAEAEFRKITKLGDSDQSATLMSLRLSLQPGATKSVGGKQYVLNQNHRWQLPGESGGSPSQAKQPQRPGSPRQSSRVPQRKPVQIKPRSDVTRPKDVPSTKIENEETTAPPPGKANFVNVEATDADGVAIASRVGVPGRVIPPPPKIPKLPNLTRDERNVESTFIAAFEADPSGMANKYRDLVRNSSKPYTFETDQAKMLSDDWVDDDKSKQMQKRALYNNALHQTANAIVKRAFLGHLDTLQPGDNVLVTVGGCGSGKGYTLEKTELGKNLTSEAKAVWDSAGDQNATENPWILEEAEKRGLTVTYAYVAGDPKVAWADPGRGVVTRAHDPKDGRMVDAAVFADSYVLGARNHHAFHQKNKDNKSAKFLSFSAVDQSEVPGVPESSLKVDRKSLYHWALGSIQGRSDVTPSVMRGGTNGARIWNEEFFGGQ